MELMDEVHCASSYERGGAVTSNSDTSEPPNGGSRRTSSVSSSTRSRPPTGMDVGKKVELRREGLLPLQGMLEPPAATGRPYEKPHDAGCRDGELAGDRAGAGRALASAILLLRPEPGRRSGDDERAICLHRRPAAAGQLSGHEPDVGGLEGLLALRRRDLYLRLFRDGHGGRSREGAGGNPAASQGLSRRKLGRGRRAIVPRLRRFAQRRAPGFDHVEHGSNRRQETRRSSHRFCPQKLGADMTVSSAILLDHTAEHVPALMQVAGLASAMANNARSSTFPLR